MGFTLPVCLTLGFEQALQSHNLAAAATPVARIVENMIRHRLGT